MILNLAFTQILGKHFEPTPQDCRTVAEDIQAAVTLNPDLEIIAKCMQDAYLLGLENGKVRSC